MASLRNIMNTDDDQTDSDPIQRPHNSASRSTQISNSSNLNPGFPNSGQPSMSTLALNSYPGSSSNSSRSLAYEVSSATSISRIDSERRRSNASTDSTDSRYRPGQASSSSMSPYTSGRSSGEPHVKLTPITKRISKAKKGVAVHVCDQCNKTFTRAEHLRRHQLSHQPPDLSCRVPGCDKVFHRKDLLERHHQRHEQDEASSREGSQSSSKRRSSKTTELNFGTPSRESGLQMPQGFGGPGSSVSPDPSNTSNLAPASWQSMVGTPNAGTAPLPSPQMQDGNEGYTIGRGVEGRYIIAPTMNGLQTRSDDFTPGFSEPREMPNMSHIYLSEAGPTGLPWTDSSGMPSSGSGSTYSTTPDPSRRQAMPIRPLSGEWNNTPLPTYTTVQREVRSPPMDTSGYAMTYSYATSPPHYSTIYAEGLGILGGYSEESTIYGPAPIHTATVRSLSPQMALAQSSETLVALPSALPSDRMMGISSCGRQQSDMLNMSIKDTMPVSLPRAARDAIPSYLEVYWERVDPLNPIIHKPTFEDSCGGNEEHSQVLQCAMAAVATQYLADKEHRIRGEQLHAYTQFKSELFTQSEKWPLQVFQIALLCDYYARYRGKRKGSYRPSQRFVPMYERAIQIQIAFPTFMSNSRGPRLWKEWVEYETHRRLFAACFLLDVHSARYHEQAFAPILGLDYDSPGTLPIPLSADTTQLWAAETHEAWTSLPHPTHLRTLSNIQLETVTPSDIASAPPYDASIILAACSLHLPRRQNIVGVDLINDASSIQTASMYAVVLFSTSGIANTYMALHYTPLHFLLSVSGDSWVFNKKVMPVSSFTEHQKQLGLWRNSGSAAAATVFAARALKAFLRLSVESPKSRTGKTRMQKTPIWSDISDYWGVYVCVLICWAYGHAGKREKMAEAPSRDSSIQWILKVAEMEPAQVEEWPGRSEAYGVVGLVRKELAKDCVGGRNILFADAVRVLEKLEQGGNWKWF